MDQESPWAADVLLADGGSVHIRPIRPGDRVLLESFHERQSPQSIYYRYFSPRPTLTDADLERLTRVDYSDRMAFVALLGSELVGVARYDRYPATEVAEVAFFTDEAQRGRGLATVLLEYLAAAARDAGLAGFVAQVLPENRRMLSVFSKAGFEVQSRFSDGVIEVELGIEPTDAARASIEDRARAAYARSVHRLLAPTSIAVIGVSRDPSAIGSRVVTQLLRGGFTGRVHPVSRTASSVAGLDTVGSVLEIADDVDVAVVCVPANEVRRVVLECGRRHVHGLVVITAGLSEVSDSGKVPSLEIAAMARRRGMRIIGPNSMGVINTAADVSMHATFVEVHPRSGGIGVSSQSGTLGAAIIEHAARRGLGISTFVALGGRPDVSNNDLLSYWEDDPATTMVLLYLERFGNPANFARITRRLTRVKPVIAVKSAGTLELEPSDSGLPSRASVDALLAQTGIIRVDTLPELFDVATVLTHQPIARGRRLAIVSNARGPALLALDAVGGVGLEPAQVTYRGLENPIDLGFDVDADGFAAALASVGTDPGVDAVLVLCTPPLPGAIDDFAARIARAAGDLDIPIVATYLGLEPTREGAAASVVPVFDFPEAAVRALGRIASYGEWLGREQGVLPDEELVGSDQLQHIRGELAGRPSGWLDHERATRVVAQLWPDLVEQCVTDDVDDAVAAADRLGWPVALKAGGLERPAKTEAGGVAVDLHDAVELRHAHVRMRAYLGSAMDTGIVQKMAPAGVDVRVGVVRSPLVGSILTLEVDRTFLEGPAEASLQVVPCSDVDALAMVRRARLVEAFEGSSLQWGGDAQDEATSALVGLLQRLSVLVEEVPEITTIVLDPVIVAPSGVFVTDVRVRVASSEPDELVGVRGLIAETG